MDVSTSTFQYMFDSLVIDLPIVMDDVSGTKETFDFQFHQTDVPSILPPMPVLHADIEMDLMGIHQTDVPSILPPMPVLHADIERDLMGIHQQTRTSAYAPLQPTGVIIYTMTVNVDPEEGSFGRQPGFVTKFLANEKELMASMNTQSKYKFVRQEYTKMKNSIILKTTRSSAAGTSVKVMKLFNNAKIQMNGVQSFEDIQLMIRLYKHLLKDVYMVNYVIVNKPRISMMNGRFNTSTTLDLVELFDVCEEAGESVVLNKELNPAMRLKAGSATVFVFSSGKVLIMGSKTAADMTLGFTSIMHIIMMNHARVYLDPGLMIGM